MVSGKTTDMDNKKNQQYINTYINTIIIIFLFILFYWVQVLLLINSLITPNSSIRATDGRRQSSIIYSSYIQKMTAIYFLDSRDACPSHAKHDCTFQINQAE